MGQDQGAPGSSGVGALRRACSGLGSCLGTSRWVHEWDLARNPAKGLSHYPLPAPEAGKKPLGLGVV